MRISLKLTMAFLAIASLVAAAGYLGQRTTAEVRTQIQRLKEGAVPRIVGAADTTAALYGIHLAAHRLVAEERRRSRNEAELVEPPSMEASIETQRTAVEQGLEMLRSAAASRARWEAAEAASPGRATSLPRTSPSLPALQEKWFAHQRLMGKLRQTVKEDTDQAELLIDEQLCRHFQSELLPLLNVQHERSEQDLTEAVNRVERSLAIADTHHWKLTVVAAAVAVLVGLVMSRSIGRRLAILQRAAADVGHGRLDTRVVVEGRDEIGNLGQTLNQMAADLQEKTVSRQRLLDSLREKDLLLMEVHHRVKNNLQVVSSLLNLQAQELHDPQMIRVFEECQGRVHSLALVHEQLYRSQDLSRIDFAAYVQELVEHLARGTGAAATRVRFQFDLQPLPLPLDQAIPCGMIVNELVSNALEHAFPEGRSGTVHIAFSGATPNYCLTVADDGIGLPKGLLLGKPRTLGLKVVQALIRQIHGRLDVQSGQGAAFVIRLSAEQSSAAPPAASGPRADSHVQ